MANALYDAARALLLGAGINWTSDTIECVLGTSSIYTVNLTTHQYYSSMNSGVIAGPVALASKAVTAGAADANDVTFSSVSGVAIQFIGLYKSVTNPSDSPLIAYIDTATGLPITPNGGDIIVTWDNGPNKIFKP
jgi:hypothetical protein